MKNQAQYGTYFISEGLPGIRGPLAFRPEMTWPLNEFMEVLMGGENALTMGERELIATCVSSQNDCFFCQQAHGATAQHYLQCDIGFIDAVKTDFESTDISAKLKSLLTTEGSVQKGGKYVSNDHIETARNYGATDLEIHDTVLIGATFCKFNRYGDGLDTRAPEHLEFYINRAK